MNEYRTTAQRRNISARGNAYPRMLTKS
ncbi:hypothetical protein E2C01_095236 [Portunus trituberculatus]|uniref:Uncharacterized protein n=1 Tax=Portunus trituberculatus TaxID=210409 RepID=A0A5B7K3P2_PORTR|nr:hypothetical protein [Portunus trituberculatus]